MQGFVPWTQDDAGDLVNLALMECIYITPLDDEQKEEEREAHPDWTHELVAVAPDQRSWRLAVGSLEHCQANRDRLARMLLRSELDPHLMAVHRKAG